MSQHIDEDALKSLTELTEREAGIVEMAAIVIIGSLRRAITQYSSQVICGEQGIRIVEQKMPPVTVIHHMTVPIDGELYEVTTETKKKDE